MATKESQFLTPVAAQIVDELHASTGLAKKLIMSAGVLAFQEQWLRGDTHNITRALVEKLEDAEKELTTLLKSLRRDQQEIVLKQIGFSGGVFVAASFMPHDGSTPSSDAELHDAGGKLVKNLAEMQAESVRQASHRERARDKAAKGS